MKYTVSPLAGHELPPDQLINLEQIDEAYYNPPKDVKPIEFGTTGYRGNALNGSFTQLHVAVITQAICDHRRERGITGPIFFGKDTHYLSQLAYLTALEVFTANKVKMFVHPQHQFVPTPAVSLAIIAYNKEHPDAHGDGIIFSPSHNPPDDGGFKYNPPHGGSCDSAAAKDIEQRTCYYLQHPEEVKREELSNMLSSELLLPFDFIDLYVKSLPRVVDMQAIVDAHFPFIVDAQGGASFETWAAIIEHYKLNATLLHDTYDPTFSFLCADFDGRLRPDCCSKYSERNFIALSGKAAIAMCNDPDADRYGILGPEGFMSPNTFYSVAIDYLLTHRKNWDKTLHIGKTFPSTLMIDRILKYHNVGIYQMPVGFKYFSVPIAEHKLLLAGEESAGMTMLDRFGDVWTTDKDGLVPALLAAEILAVTGKTPGEYYATLVKRFGETFADRMDFVANDATRKKLRAIRTEDVKLDTLCGEPILELMTHSDVNNTPLNGIKIVTEKSWLALRPSGNEHICKVYAETQISPEHLKKLFDEGVKILNRFVVDDKA